MRRIEDSGRLENARRSSGQLSKGRKALLITFVCITAALLVLVGGYAFITTRYPLQYEDNIHKYAEKYNLDPNYIAAIIWTESRFDAKDESGAGARGLMQVMPETGEWIAGKIDMSDYDADVLFDPDTNMHMGCWYLNFLDEKFSVRDTQTAAYNAGHGIVTEWLGDSSYSDDGKKLKSIPYPETKKYVEKVNSAYNIYKTFYDL